jgi:hypothetical protein
LTPRWSTSAASRSVEDTTRELQRVVSFLGIHAKQADLLRAADLSSAARMREMEKTEGETWIGTRGRRTDIPFVGTARSGSWKTDLPKPFALAIEDAWKPILQQLKYEVSPGRPGSPLARPNRLHRLTQPAPGESFQPIL